LRVEYAETVGAEDGVVRREAGLCGEDVVGGVRDEHGVVAGIGIDRLSPSTSEENGHH
jgi:hypothetical protein